MTRCERVENVGATLRTVANSRGPTASGILGRVASRPLQVRRIALPGARRHRPALPCAVAHRFAPFRPAFSRWKRHAKFAQIRPIPRPGRYLRRKLQTWANAPWGGGDVRFRSVGAAPPPRGAAGRRSRCLGRLSGIESIGWTPRRAIHAPARGPNRPPPTRPARRRRRQGTCRS
jgi:hypothetical protein